MKKKIKQLNNQKNQLAVCFCTAVFLFSYYGYLINNTISNVAERDEKEHIIEQLSSTVEDLENTVLANAGLSAFDGIFPMLFAKLWDEFYPEWIKEKWPTELVSAGVKRVDGYIIKLSMVYAVMEGTTSQVVLALYIT